jgi:hypothetical protein
MSDTNEPEPVPGFPAYRLYPDGTIESRWRSGMFYSGFETEDKWTRPKLRRHEQGYLGIDLRDGRGRSRRTYIHILIAEIFISPKPFVNAIVRHLDGDSSNNRVENLAWGTYKENEDDKIRHGTWNTRNGGAKLSIDQVSEIRKRCDAGESQKDIALEFGVSRPTITRIANHTIWRTQ